MTSQPRTSGWGPTVEGRTRRRRPLRALVWLLLIALLAAVALAFVVSSRIPREPVDGLARSGRPMHVLVIGSDSRAGLSREERNELTTGHDDSAERTDTIFLMTIDGGRVGLLAFPRDLWVRRCDGSTGRINVAFQIGGASCLVRTVRDLSGIDVQHTARITFGGFRDVVDAVGGVEVCLDQPIADRDAGIDLPAGCQRLDGVDALGYVRVRKIDDDLQRIRRQQTFVRALASEIASPSTLLNPMRLYRLSEDIGGAVTFDDRFGLLQLARLARGARGLAGGANVAETVPATPGMAGAAAVLYIDEVAAAPLFAAFRNGSILDGAGAGANVDPADVPVVVLNGAGVDGLAGRVAGVLEGRGHPVAETGNTEARQRTVIRHPASRRPAAELVARGVPGPVTFEVADVAHVTVLLGRDAAGG